MKLRVLMVLVGLVGSGTAWGQASLRPGASPAAPGDMSKPSFDTSTPRYDSMLPNRPGTTVIAEVDGRAITLADIGEAIRLLPPSVAAMPFENLLPLVLDRLVQREALVARARAQGLDEDPEMKRRIRSLSETALTNELLQREGAKRITQAALLERYRNDYAGKPGPTEVKARAIMVPTESEAMALIEELRGGADFAAVARRASKDTTQPAGGDLGWVTREGLTPEIAAVTFALAPGQVTAFPVRSGGSWFIVKVEDRRQAPTPSFPVARPRIQERMLAEIVPDIVRQALADATLRYYTMNGRETTADDAGR